jgi:SIR2-like domain
MVHAFDPLVMLATGVHAKPGVYALLLGSGVSTGAGIPTGWGIVQELVRRSAAAHDPDNAGAADTAAADPDAWWDRNGDGQPLGYSNLLAALAPTSAARQALLAGFFEPNEADAEAGRKVPGAAHRAIAQMARRGLIRVILTTNFDRMMERALEEAGIPPQVVSSPQGVVGLTPLQHAGVTVIKLHGDYTDLEMRNTVDELSTYPLELDTLLDRVLDEYGLIISGWSADWDKALVAAMERLKSRRYPLYWDSRSSKGEAARRLLAQHSGVVTPTASADDLFTGLLDRVDALDRIAEPPLTTAVAVARLKRYLPDPVRRIDLDDLMNEAVTTVADKAAAYPTHLNNLDGQALDDRYAAMLSDVTLVLHLLIEGIYHDQDRDHTGLWVKSIHRLMLARGLIRDAYKEALDGARHYPALLALRAAGVASLVADRDDVLFRLLTEPTWRDPLNRDLLPAVLALRDYTVASADVVNTFPRWSGQRWLYPPSHLLRADLREVLRPILPDDDDYRSANDRYEYRVALTQYHLEARPAGYARCTPGEFIGTSPFGGRQWADGQPRTEADFRAAAGQANDDWPWWSVVGGPADMETTLTSLRQELSQMVRFG